VYRSLGKLSSFGVPSGPYTGKPRHLVWRDLPDDVKRRLLAALEGRGRPAPIALDVPRPSRLARRLVGFATLGTVMLGALVVHSWPSAQPGWFSLLYALAVLPVALLGALLVHRRLARGGAPLDPGKVLFPLDLLSFDGRTLTLTPLGSVRDVGIVGDITTLEKDPLRLVLRFESGEEVSFPMPSVTHADRTYEALVEAQKTLEVLSYSDDLEKALDHDPFFAVRTGGGVDAGAVPARAARAVPFAAMLAPAFALALGAGHLAFVATGGFSDEMRFQRAFSANSEAAMNDYLARGGTRVAEATYFLGARKAERRKQLELDRMRERVARNEALLGATVSPAPKNPPGFVRPKTPEQWNTALGECLRALTAAAPSPSKLLPSLTALVDEARRGVGGPAKLPVRFERTFEGSEAIRRDVERSLDAREQATARALAVVLSETCPPAVLEVHHERGKARLDGPALVVRYVVRKPTTPDAPPLASLPEIRFDATVEVWPKKPVGFALTMPPPAVPGAALRERSLFRVDEDAPPYERIVATWSARAFDRLYDELYALFFAGPVKVPLPGFAEVERIFMK